MITTASWEPLIDGNAEKCTIALPSGVRLYADGLYDSPSMSDDQYPKPHRGNPSLPRRSLEVCAIRTLPCWFILIEAADMGRPRWQLMSAEMSNVHMEQYEASNQPSGTPDDGDPTGASCHCLRG